MKSRVLTMETIIKNLEANVARSAEKLALVKGVYEGVKREHDDMVKALAQLRGQAPELPIESTPSEAAI